MSAVTAYLVVAEAGVGAHVTADVLQLGDL